MIDVQNLRCERVSVHFRQPSSGCTHIVTGSLELLRILESRVTQGVEAVGDDEGFRKVLVPIRKRLLGKQGSDVVVGMVLACSVMRSQPDEYKG